MSKQTLSDKAAAVKAEAEKNYEKSFGWQEFIECYSDRELEEFVAEASTVEEAVRRATEIADIRTDLYDDARAEIF